MGDQDDRGIDTRTPVRGEDIVVNALANATEFTLPVRHYTIRNAWSDVWQRERLDRKTAARRPWRS